MALIDLALLQSTEILVPFLFILAVVFGILELTRFFKNRAVNAIIAVTLSIFTMTNSWFVNLLWSYFGSISVFFIAMFFIAFVFEIFGVRRANISASVDGMIVNGAVLLVLFSIGYTYIDIIPEMPFIGGGENLLLFLGLVFVLAIFWAAYKIGSGHPPAK